MEIEIVNTPVQFRLHGRSGAVPNHAYAEVGLGLMNEMWQVVKQEHLKTTGINHWVYLDDGSMFVGVEVLKTSPAPSQLQPLEFQLHRYLKHVHVGPYQALPQKWQALKTELSARGETMSSPSLEVYGHHCDDAAKQETTILIALQ